MFQCGKKGERRGWNKNWVLVLLSLEAVLGVLEWCGGPGEMWGGGKAKKPQTGWLPPSDTTWPACRCVW